MQLNVIQLKQKIDRLELLFKEVLLSLENKDHEAYKNSIFSYKKVKKEILLSLFETPVHQTDSRHFKDVRKVLQRLTLNGDPFLPDKYKVEEEFKDITIALHHDLDIVLNDEEQENYAGDLFYSWFSGEEYAKAQIKSQLLILRADRVPKKLSHFVDEIRSCYAFQNYTAAFSLCRTLLEIAVRAVYNSNKLHRHDTEFAEPTIEYFNQEKKGKRYSTINDFDPDLFDRIEILCKLPKFEPLKNDLHEVRTLGNSIVHANRTADKETATGMIQMTFNVIQNLYEAN